MVCQRKMDRLVGETFMRRPTLGDRHAMSRSILEPQAVTACVVVSGERDVVSGNLGSLDIVFLLEKNKIIFLNNTFAYLNYI